MLLQKARKPATAETANGLRNLERLGSSLEFKAIPSADVPQDFFVVDAADGSFASGRFAEGLAAWIRRSA
jgi:hypothetical protein